MQFRLYTNFEQYCATLLPSQFVCDHNKGRLTLYFTVEPDLLSPSSTSDVLADISDEISYKTPHSGFEMGQAFKLTQTVTTQKYTTVNGKCSANKDIV